MPCEPSQEQRMDSANIQPLQFHKSTQQLDVFSEEDTITQGCNIQYTPFFGLTEIPLRCSTFLSVNCDFQLAVTEYLLYGTPWRKYARSLSDPIMIPGHTWNHPRQRVIFYGFHFRSETEREEVGKKGRFHFLSPIHNQPGEASYTQTSFNL